MSVGQTAGFSIGASGAGLSYQWQSQAPGASSFTAITGATGTNYATPATTMSDSGTQFRCQVSNGSGTVTSSAASLTVTTPPPAAVRVNAGGGAYTDSHGNQWSADFGYSAPSTSFVASATIQGTNDPSLYLSERYNYPGDLQYSFSVPSGSYIVNLKFAENYCTAAACRTFDVVINGQRVLSRFDIFALAGGASRALDEQFMVSTSGTITIQFLAVIGASKVNAIEILPTVPGLSITSYHNGSFSQGQTGAVYSLQVSNGTASAPTAATIRHRK